MVKAELKVQLSPSSSRQGFICRLSADRAQACTQEWHKQKIGGRYIVQVDEVVNIALPIRQRHGQNGKGRCVKMSLTDGKQQVEGLEYRHLPDVGPDMPAGFKMALTDVEVRRGMLLLQPENTQVLGGCVARLEDARQRCLTSLRKPAEGRGGNRNMQPIHPAAAATAAAWPSILPANQAPSSIPIQVFLAADIFTNRELLGRRLQPQEALRMLPQQLAGFQDTSAQPRLA
ncbi:hypothetical protein WJX84_001913 [Apatococcus fuscideae]|uniref:RecQ-mediated genome instability protein 1 n=1 Tax=Apatococcus fuscideae TaxID=2026836 RepID=A0AAW1RP08_9CHLO